MDAAGVYFGQHKNWFSFYFLLLKNCTDTTLLFAQPEDKGIAISLTLLLRRINQIQLYNY